MIKTSLLSITAVLGLATIGNASIVTLSGGRTGPLVITSASGDPVAAGLVRVGTLSGAPASDSVDDIDAVFAEFATGVTAADGKLGQTFNNASAAAFNNQQIYVWVFNTATTAPAAGQEHGVFTLVNGDDTGAGTDWFFPVHTGSGTDSVTVTLAALFTDGDTSVTPGIGLDAANGGGLTLVPVIPEPSGALLAGLAGMLLVFRRRR